MEQRKTQLSILIPVYNTVCVDIVRRLQLMAEQAELSDYEIIVADDASPLKDSREQNEQINALPHCSYIIKEVNSGSAATRNFLARKSRYPWLLFIDSDVEVVDDRFLSRYLTSLSAPVVNGGLAVGGDDDTLRHNLRYRYEKAEAPQHTASRRQQRPYQSFRSTNFLVSRQTMLDCPFDERFRNSGYEDVFLGKKLRQQHIAIAHIDNPVVMTDYEDNATYVAKMERNLQTLHHFRQDLKGYSKLITLSDGIHLKTVRRCLTAVYRFFRPMMRRNLCSSHPSLFVFKLYKTGYYLSIKN